MFGEDLLIGNATVRIDQCHRFFVPKFTNAEPNDKIAIQKIKLVKDEKEQQVTEYILKLMAYKEYVNMIERLKRLRDNARSYEDYIKYDKYIEEICQRIECIATLDKHKRIKIPIDLFIKLNWDIDNSYSLTGTGHTVLVREIKKQP